MKLSLTEKWTAMEEMAILRAPRFEWRREQGLPYIDPYTSERVSPAAVIREEPPASSQAS